MRVVVQRCKNASVKVNDKIIGKIDKGYLLFVGFTNGDNENVIKKMAKKIVNLRIFEDKNDKMNLSLKEVNASILSVSQFTLYAKLNGRRPSFTDALNYNEAKKLYEYFNLELEKQDVKVENGIFGADMKVNLLNDGPVTIIIDSEDILWKNK